MLDRQDIELIQQLNRESEQRMIEKFQEVEQRMTDDRHELEQRLASTIQDVEQRLGRQIQDSEMRMIAMMEAYFNPKFQALGEKIDLMMEQKASTEITEDLDDRVAYLETAVDNNTRDIMRLKLAR